MIKWTTIRITETTKKALNQLKVHERQTHDELLRILIGRTKETER